MINLIYLEVLGVFVKLFLVTFHYSHFRNFKVLDTSKTNILRETPDWATDV